MVAVKLELPVDKRFFVRTGDNLGSSTLSSAWVPNQSEFVTVDTSRRVWSYKPKEYKGSEAPIPLDSKGHHFGSAVVKVVRVGTTLYAIGSPFRIFQRIKGQQWKEMAGIPIPAAFVSGDRKKIIEAVGDSVFHDLAGFSDSDMYAVGGAGTVWHFDGKRWRQTPFPTNAPLYTVACGENGDVYITDIRGNLWKGGGTKWSLLCEMDQSLPFKDSHGSTDACGRPTITACMSWKGKSLSQRTPPRAILFLTTLRCTVIASMSHSTANKCWFAAATGRRCTTAKNGPCCSRACRWSTDGARQR